jgi:hypothetical protein
MWLGRMMRRIRVTLKDDADGSHTHGTRSASAAASLSLGVEVCGLRCE